MNKKNIILYTVAAYAWSYILWGIAILYALTNNVELILNEGTVEALYNNGFVGRLGVMSLLAMLATLGPLFGSILVSIKDKTFGKEYKTYLHIKVQGKYFLQVLGIFLFVGLVPALPLIFIDGTNDVTIPTALLYTITLFGIQLVSSGAEEYGWRGFLLPEFLKKFGAWDSSFYTAIIWALWHLPIVLYIFHLQGMPIFAMLFSFVGFSVGIVAMSVVHTYYFTKTKSTFFAVFIHSIGNTIPFISGYIIANSYKVAIFTQLLIWVVVAIIINRNKNLFPKKEK